MKTIALIFTILFFSLGIKAQLVNVEGNNTRIFINPVSSINEKGVTALEEKKYLNKTFRPAIIDTLKAITYLRYNIFDDQMEVESGDKIYIIKKDVGRKIRFTSPKALYKVYELDGSLNYFLVLTNGKAQLLAKQIVKFIPAEETTSSYKKAKEAHFKRNKDLLYLYLNDNLVKIPSKKSSFPAIFGTKEAQIKSFMKKNKLRHKKVEDIKKVVQYYNTL